MGWIIDLLASGITGDRDGNEIKPLPEVRSSNTTGDKPPEVVPSRTTRDTKGEKIKPLPEVRPSNTTGGRKGKKIEAGPSDIKGDKPPEVVPSRTTRDGKGEKIKLLPEVRPSNITGDRKGKKIEAGPSDITGDKPPEGGASGTKRNGEMEMGESTSSERRDLSTANRMSDSKDIDDVKRFSFDDVVAATNNFSDQNKLGEGGFGPVFKVIII